jgi:hypothetical protein
METIKEEEKKVWQPHLSNPKHPKEGGTWMHASPDWIKQNPGKGTMYKAYPDGTVEEYGFLFNQENKKRWPADYISVKK